MSTPSGIARAQQFMAQLPHRPPLARGSFADLVAQEMFYRDRRRMIAENVYTGQLLAAGLNIPAALFNAWSANYEDEVMHGNYRPSVVAEKKRLLEAFLTRRKVDHRHIDRIEKYAVQSSEDLKPYTKEERLKIQSRLRKRALKDATSSAQAPEQTGEKP